jgi:hypothetical protein
MSEQVVLNEIFEVCEQVWVNKTSKETPNTSVHIACSLCSSQVNTEASRTHIPSVPKIVVIRTTILVQI